jgi:hypothetical protein
MDLASAAVYAAPFVRAASPKVARATEGAPPKSPAKLFGLKRSPSKAKVETKAPPIAKRNKISVKDKWVHFLGSRAIRSGDQTSVSNYLATLNLPRASCRRILDVINESGWRSNGIQIL